MKILKFNILLFLCCISVLLYGNHNNSSKKDKEQLSDRDYWVSMLCKMSEPILSNMSEGTLKENMVIELSPVWDGRNTQVAYTEAFGRLMAGIAPWLNLPEDNTPEGLQRKQFKEWAIKSYTNAVDPTSADYLSWKAHHQTLVDAAYIANSFLRAPKALWEPLSQVTKERYIKEFKELRSIRPPYNNWVLFRAMLEAFFLSIGEEYDGYVLEVAMRKANEWYLSDGWYSDGPEFSFDYYNAYVMHPMIVEIAETLEQNRMRSPIKFDLALKRMQRYNQFLERLISPEATYPAFGRSMTYRMGAFQPIALSAWKYQLPQTLTNGQVRNALTSVMKRMFSVDGNFGKEGYLQLGFVGHQPNLADYYTNNGSLYITSLVFLPLGLPAEHKFWTDTAEDWTSKKAWKGEAFQKDYHESIKQ